MDTAAVQANVRTEADEFSLQITSIEEVFDRETPAGYEVAGFAEWKAQNCEHYLQDVELQREEFKAVEDGREKIHQEMEQAKEEVATSLSSQMQTVRSSLNTSMNLEEQQNYDAIMEALKHSPAVALELYKDQAAVTNQVKAVEELVNSLDLKLKKSVKGITRRHADIFCEGIVELQVLEERLSQIQLHVASRLDELADTLQSRHVAAQEDIRSLKQRGENINELLDQQETVLSTQAGRLTELQEEASGLESANARLTDERDTQDKVRASLEEHIKDLSDQVLSLQIEKAAMMQAQEASEEARTTLQTDLDTSRSASAAKDESIRALQTQLHDARAEKEEVAGQLTTQPTACDETSRKLSEATLEAYKWKTAAGHEVSRSKEKRDADKRRELWLIKRLSDTMADRIYDVRPTRSPVRELEDIEIKLSKMQEAGGRPSPPSLPPIMFYNDPPRTAEVQETDGESLWIMALTGRMHVSGVQDLLDETLRPDLRLKLLPWIEAATWQMISSIQAIDLNDVRVFHLVLGLILLRCIAYLQSSLSLSPANATLFDLRAMLDELESSAAWQELVFASLFVRIAYDSVRDMLSGTPTPEQWTSRVMRAIDEAKEEIPAGVALTSRNSYLPEAVHLIMDFPHYWALVIHAGTPGEKIFMMWRYSPEDPVMLIHHESVALYKVRTSIRLGHVHGLPAEFHNMELMMDDIPDVTNWIERYSS